MTVSAPIEPYELKYVCEDFHTLNDVVKLFNISKTTLYKKIKKGEFNVVEVFGIKVINKSDLGLINYINKKNYKKEIKKFKEKQLKELEKIKRSAECI